MIPNIWWNCCLLLFPLPPQNWLALCLALASHTWGAPVPALLCRLWACLMDHGMHWGFITEVSRPSVVNYWDVITWLAHCKKSLIWLLCGVNITWYIITLLCGDRCNWNTLIEAEGCISFNHWGTRGGKAEMVKFKGRRNCNNKDICNVACILDNWSCGLSFFLYSLSSVKK